MLRLRINGQESEFEGPLTGAQLLAELGIVLSTMVAEVNGRIVPRAEFAELQLQDGDALELVTIVGGG
jgi:thiamine biosynthesis protein ThiS